MGLGPATSESKGALPPQSRRVAVDEEAEASEVPGRQRQQVGQGRQLMSHAATTSS